MKGIRSRSSSARFSMYRRWLTILGCSSISRPRRLRCDDLGRRPRASRCPLLPGPPARTGSDRFGGEDRPRVVVVLISHPLIDVGPELSPVLEVAVELVGDDEALFEVEVADREAIGTHYVVGVDGADVGVIHPHHLEQLIQIVPLPPDGQFGQPLSN